MSLVVLDASVTVAWGLGDERSAAAEHVRDRVELGGAIAPGIWPFEVASALVAAERRGQATAAETGRFLTLLRHLPVEIVDGRATVPSTP